MSPSWTSTPQEATLQELEEATTFPDLNFDPPILKLHDDVLGCIFMINTVDGEYAGWGRPSRRQNPALNTARFTSQVCRHWREMILESPSIWANIIDLHLLRQKSNHWRNEVMKRTGTAPLWISGDVVDDDGISPSFFFVLLNDHWQRIRGLEVRVIQRSSTERETWKALRRPAPNLEVLSIRFEISPVPSYLTTWDPDSSLFSTNAPLIQEFNCPLVAFCTTAGWVPQLRAITLSYPLFTHDLFSLLANMPLLEYLVIQNNNLQLTDFHVPGNPSSRILMPRLKKISLHHRFKTCHSILERITASAGCALDLTTYSDFTDVTSGEIAAFQATLTQYSTGYFNATPQVIKDFALDLSTHEFKFSVPTSPGIPSMFNPSEKRLEWD